MPDIFVAYKNEEFSRVEGIIAALSRIGYDPWWHHKLLPGDIFDKEIETIIADVSVGIVVWSHLSVHSNWVRGEAIALQKRGVLIPVAIDELKGLKIPVVFQTNHTLDLSNWNGDENDPVFLTLLAAIKERGATPAHGVRNENQVVAYLKGQEEEKLFWSNLGAHSSLEEYRLYLKRWPNGTFRIHAELRIKEREQDIEQQAQESADAKKARPSRVNAFVATGCAVVVAGIAILAYFGLESARDWSRVFFPGSLNPSIIARNCHSLAGPSPSSVDQIGGRTLDGLKQDITEAYFYCRSAMEDLEPDKEIQALYARVLFAKGDRDAALKLARQSAEVGSNLGKNLAGFILSESTKLAEKDESLKFYLDAAKSGYTLSQANAGRSLRAKAYNSSEPSDELYKEAFRWLEISSDAGNVDAKLNLGEMYAEREGVHVTGLSSDELDKKALKLFEYISEAERGNGLAESWIGYLYDKGRVAKEKTKLEQTQSAMAWYIKSANKGHAFSQRRLGQMYMCEDCSPNESEPDKDSQAVYWLKMAANNNDAQAEYCLGIMFRQQRGVELKIKEVNFYEAWKSFKKAADKDHTLAQLELANMYRDRQGVNPEDGQYNDEQAVLYYKKAAKKNNRDAHLQLGWMYMEGRGVGGSDRQASDQVAKFHLEIVANGDDKIAEEAKRYLQVLQSEKRIN